MNAMLGIVAAALIALGVQTWRISMLKADIATTEAALATEKAAAEKAAREREQQMADSARKAADAYSVNAAKLRNDAAGARSELDRLRDNLAASPGPANPATTAGADDAARARQVVGQCAATLQGMAEAADQLEARLIGLQDYVRGIAGK